MSLANITSAASALANLILVSPQSTVGYQPNPANFASSLPKPILFHYEGEQTVLCESDITDHYVEDNTAIQDQIALHPEVITTHGFIGELNNVPANPILAAAQVIANKLTAVAGYTPGLSATALLAYNEAVFLYSTANTLVNSAVSAWDTITGQGGESVIDGNGITVSQNQTKQQVVFQQFYGYWRNRTLFTVQTPWAVFQNCAILSLRPIQDAETNVITDFELRFKLMRFANTITSASPTFNGSQDGARTQTDALVDHGNSTPPLSPISFGNSVRGAIA